MAFGDYEHLEIGDIIRLVRKEFLHLKIKELASAIGRSVSMLQHAETNIRLLKSDDLAKIAELLEDKGQGKELYNLLLKKTALKASEKYGDLTVDKGTYLTEDALSIIVKDFKKSRLSCKALGVHLDVGGPQVRKMLQGQMALNRKQLIKLAEGTGGNPELYLLLGGHLTDNMATLLKDLPEIFGILDRSKYLNDEKKERFIARVREALAKIT